MGKSGKWAVDHSLDPVQSSSDSEIAGTKPDIEDVSDLLETPEEKKARKRSHWVAYTTMFVMSIGFSIVLSGVWPYMQELDPNLEKKALGFVVAANPFGQMVASPLLGIWGNRAGSIRGACIVTVICFIGGNMMYAMLYAFQGQSIVIYMMVLSRFIVGVSSANVSLCRSYLAGSTTLKERTTGIAIIAAAQAFGFVVGPGIQALLVVVVKEKIETSMPAIVWDKFTSAGWVAAILGFINLVIVMPCIFQEYNIAEKERKVMNKDAGGEVKLPKPDYIGISGILFAFFIDLFIYVLLETLAEPFVTDQYAVDDDYAMVAVGVALIAGGLLSLAMYAVTTRLAKKFDERKLIIFMGMVPTVIGTFLYLPWGDQKIQMQECVNDTDSEVLLKFGINSANYLYQPLTQEQYDQYGSFYRSLVNLEESGENSCTNGTHLGVGCPQSQDWCNDIPMLPVAQLLIAYGITITAFPVIQALAQSIYSKMLGPKPQGLWMGILTAVGSLARITGPIFVSYVYTDLGTYWTFGILEAGMIIGLIELCILYKRLVPMVLPTKKEKTGYDNPIAEAEV